MTPDAAPLLGEERVFEGRAFRAVRVHDTHIACRFCAARFVGDGLTPALSADDPQVRVGNRARTCVNHPLGCRAVGRPGGADHPFVAVDDIPRLTLKGYLA